MNVSATRRQANIYRQVRLEDDAVTVFRINCDCDDVTIEDLSTVLSLDEYDRANRFRLENDKRRFIATRATLRELLGTSLGIPPGAVHISFTESGKPFLNHSESSIYFNVSHSRDIALIAMSATKAVGVDVEYVKEGRDFLRVAERVFSPQEYEILQGADTMSNFYCLWTRREAFVKALGTGLSEGRKYQCPAGNNGSFRTIKFMLPDLGKECSVVSIPIDSGYKAAVASIGVGSDLPLR